MKDTSLRQTVFGCCYGFQVRLSKIWVVPIILKHKYLVFDRNEKKYFDSYGRHSSRPTRLVLPGKRQISLNLPCFGTIRRRPLSFLIMLWQNFYSLTLQIYYTMDYVILFLAFRVSFREILTQHIGASVQTQCILNV